MLHGNAAAVEILLRYAPVESIVRARDKCGISPFLDAIKGGHLAIVNLFFSFLSGHDSKALLHETLISDYDAIGRLPIDFAAMFGNEKIFEVILTGTLEALMVDPEERGDGRDRLYFIRKALLRRNKHFKRTPLHYAALEGHLSVMKLIVSKFEIYDLGKKDVDYAQIMLADDDGKTPIDLARIGKHSHCIDYLSSLLNRRV